jgi:hypothetical protein
VCVKVKGKILSGLLEKKNDVILKFFNGGTASRGSRVSKSSKIDKKNFKILFGEVISDRIKSARMLAKTMDYADCASRVGRGNSGMIETNLFFLSIKKSLKNSIMLFLGLANEFLMHFFKRLFFN